MKIKIEPAIMYFGTPVVLISTLNEDGTTNIAPISSVWWLGWSCMIGLDGTSKSTENLKRTGYCVLNLVSAHLSDKTNKLALLTGSQDVPIHKRLLGYKYSKNKFYDSGFTPSNNYYKGISRVSECQINLDAKVEKISEFAKHDDKMAVPAYAIELKVEEAYSAEDILIDGQKNKIDPNKWNPLIMNFRKFYSLSSELNESRLAQKPEDLYAPWKKKGLLGFLTKKILDHSNRQYGN